MNTSMQSRFGRALYEALPEVYRTRDKQDKNSVAHLAAYLDSCGTLLDAIYNSLDQRYKDCFPETCQEWLLPYFAELLGASTLSPHIEGRRKEITHAIAWRQSKGSLSTIAQIAKEIGCFEKLVMQEGWKRVARTARVDGSFVSPTVVNLRKKIPQDFVDHRNTAVCSVDVRKPDWRQGHANPHAVLLYASPYPGFFANEEVVHFKWKNVTKNASEDNVDNWFEKREDSILPSEFMKMSFDKNTGIWHFFKKPGVTQTIHIKGSKKLKAADSSNPSFQYHFTELNLDDELKVTKGTRLVLEKLAARKVVIEGSAASGIPTLIARDCLLQNVIARTSLVQLIYCTAMDNLVTDYVEASDCIFTGTLHEDLKQNNPPRNDHVRYSRHAQEDSFGDFVGNTTEVPVFYTREWGEPGCGVIHPISPKSICNGAEDGGEMGAYHHRAYVLAWEAVTRKLLEYLPVGMNAVLIPDEILRSTARTL
ncbi:MAG: phage tail protein [Betaproteobacteria bacterium]|nr:phage tail protein [Betaproteobacteria bacterium]